MKVVVKLTSQKLVDDTVASTAGITRRSTTGLGNGIQLVKEHNARSSGTSLVEDITDVAFRLTEPHTQELRTLDGNEVRRALISNSLCQQRLTSTRRTEEQHTTRR
jgi:hypothetical protein